MYLFSSVTEQKLVGQNPVIPNIHSSAIHYIIYSLIEKIVFIVLSIIYEFKTYEEMYYVLPA